MNDNAEKPMETAGKIIQNLSVTMQAAWIEWKHGKGAEVAMQWIENSLFGPGLIPDEDEPYSQDAQSYWAANRADPYPECFCGKPSSILWMQQGFCCDAHFREVKDKRAADGESS